MRKGGILFIWICLSPFLKTWGQSVINPKISEVFGQEAEEWKSKAPDHIKFFERLLSERISYRQEPYVPGEKYTKLSSIELEHKVNPNLKRDETFNPETFNPLKYRLNFYSKVTEMYRVDGTNYIIVIQGQ